MSSSPPPRPVQPCLQNHLFLVGFTAATVSSQSPNKNKRDGAQLGVDRTRASGRAGTRLYKRTWRSHRPATRAGTNGTGAPTRCRSLHLSMQVVLTVNAPRCAVFCADLAARLSGQTKGKLGRQQACKGMHACMMLRVGGWQWYGRACGSGDAGVAMAVGPSTLILRG